MWPRKASAQPVNDNIAVGLGGVAPDYTNSIVNLMHSVGAACGGPSAHAQTQLRALGQEELQEFRHIVVLAVDGLGAAYVKTRGGDGALRAHMRNEMSSVFPSTTASAITSLLTGVAPRQHAVTGWFMNVDVAQGLIAPLPFVARGDSRSLDGVVTPGEVFTVPGIFQHLSAVDTHIIYPHYLVGSVYSRTHGIGARAHAFRSLQGMFDTVLDVLRAPARTYSFAYWPQFDSLSHEHGNASERVYAHYKELDVAFDAFTKRLRGLGAIVVLTADHGFIDVAPEQHIYLRDHPRLGAMLASPLSGEPRTAYCHLKPNVEDEFVAYIGTHLHAACSAHRSSELIDSGWFGPGLSHPKLRARLGDYVLMMKSPYIICDTVPGESVGFASIGVHGGTSEMEMRVPLIVAN